MAARRLPGHQLSNSRVNRAGNVLRDWWHAQDPDPSEIEHDEALRAAAGDLFAWRDTFRYPLTKVVMGLRSFVKSESPALRPQRARLPVGQRLKRESQIIRKLGRYPTMKLSRMQDIGGCRAIMPGGPAEVAGVLRRIEHRWQVVAIQDYVERPQATGYRAIHVVVMRDGRRIEVQLRTPHQHAWAAMVEGLGLRLRMSLKEGGGDPELLRYLELAAHGLALEEAGRQADAKLRAEFLEARRQVRRYLDRPTQDPRR